MQFLPQKLTTGLAFREGCFEYCGINGGADYGGCDGGPGEGTRQEGQSRSEREGGRR